MNKIDKTARSPLPLMCLAIVATVAGMITPIALADSALDSISVPEGFEVTLAATSELTSYPMFMEFDDQGRLFIAESTGKDLSGADMVAAPECQILLLEDTDNDGVFDRRTIFAANPAVATACSRISTDI